MTVKIEMGMPTACMFCPMNRLGRHAIKPFCVLTNRPIKDEENRPSWCPLQEVKE